MTRVLLVGCGRMGRALLSGWLASGSVGAIDVVEPAAAALPEDERLRCHAAAEALPADLVPDIVVFAVKPQVLPEVIGAYRRFAGPRTVFLSIAAGRTLGFFAEHLGEGAAVVRAMPNTPAAIGRGISVLVASPTVSDSQRALAEGLLAAGGETAWVEEEGLIDAVTAVSGSGPAYVFLLVEALAAAGRREGLPEALAMRLARSTVIGAGALAAASQEDAAALRVAVTSPKGTTQAALDVLLAPDGLPALMGRAVAAAARRSRELAS